MKEISLCSQPNGGCCPVVKREGDKVIITDDFGGKVVMTHDQYLVLKGTEL